MQTTVARFSVLLTALVLMLSAAPAPGEAQAALLHAPRRPAHTRAFELDEPAQLGLAQRSLVGPTLEVAGGLTIMTFAPFAAGLVTLKAGPGLFPCGGLLSDEGDDPEDQECEARASRQQARAQAIGAGVGVAIGLIGVGVIAHGAYRIRRIRSARRDIALTGASLAPVLGGATLSLSGSF